jgi:hypothetical protein
MAAVVALLLQRYVVLIGVPVRLAVAEPLALPQVVAVDEVVNTVGADVATLTVAVAVQP